ncbi:site-specific integrase [Gillisia sp. Hel_I_29]|uniref:site-specific integrase n=1 Tax=Gillisia sp. Hel_I_29 TaxID=1249975 RepID=UPI00055356B1|nr:site-specific integrase [Gillisia sp. Hel_I_29]
MKILFLIQRSKINKKGLVPIMCRLTYNRQRKEFSTRLMVRPEDWNGHEKRLRNLLENDVLNFELEIMNQKLRKAYMLLEVKDVPFGLEDIVRLYKGESAKADIGVIQAYSEHNNYYKNLIGKDIKLISWQKFENTKGHLKDFIFKKYCQKDYKLNKLKFQFINDFEYYLKTEKEMQQSTINKALQRFKKMINFSVAHEYLDRNPFMLHKTKSVNKKILFLTEQELENLQTKKLTHKRLEEVKDCFIFCCYTGLAFTEMSNLRIHNIILDKENKNWIRMTRQKTGRNISIPLLPMAQEILDKYKGKLNNDRVLPTKTNAHFNAYLKEIAGLCDIKVNLTHHIARKTFATTVLLLNDVPMEIVSKLLGHSRIGITQAHYGQILEEKVGMVIERLSNTLKKN